MRFKIAPEPFEKLKLLGNSTQFEPAGEAPVQETVAPTTHRAPKSLPCVSEVSTPGGKKPILKAMMTTACERDCHYCPFRAGRNKTERITFGPDEMASVFDTMQRAKTVDGLFLSSGIIKGSVTTQDKIIDTAEIIRRRYRYPGYIHLKIMPGAEYDQVARAMQLADRVSVNLEGPTPQRLQALAPKKDYWTELIDRLRWISEIRSRTRLRTSIVTQFVVGAVGDTDLELLQTSEYLFRQLGLKRTYFSAFHPVSETPFDQYPSVSPLREFRLYQASFLLRDYDWNLEDLPFGNDADLCLAEDPKLAWAQAHLSDAPIEINVAPRRELLRVPGIGPIAAAAILRSRRRGKITDIAYLRKAGVRDVHKAAPYLLLNGRRPEQQMSLF